MTKLDERERQVLVSGTGVLFPVLFALKTKEHSESIFRPRPLYLIFFFTSCAKFILFAFLDIYAKFKPISIT
jgi:hypothetical protein